MDKRIDRPQGSRQVETINIRYFEARDAETCFKIRSAAFIQKFYDELGACATSAGVNAFMPDDYVRMARTSPFFVAEDADRVIGFFAIHRKDKRVAEIPLIYIELNQLGRKIGRIFMEHI